jgi:2-polyprenyl-6-methoxyphenol hydroxylase-like FAD-dependent oxidoreductase
MGSTASDVVIVGAGPTGLLLAGDLAAAGVRTTVLERRGAESNLTRAFALHARTLELLDARGIADAVLATGTVLKRLRLFDRVDVDLSRLPSRFACLLITPQYNTERVLAERAQALGAEIVPGAEVVGLHQDDDGVELEVRGQDGSMVKRSAAYVVGADGVHSAVRRALGLPYPGHAAIRSMMLADVRLTEQPPDVLAVNGVRDGFAFIAPFGDGWYRVIALDRRDQQPDSAPVELDEIRAITRRALGTDYGMHDARWLSRFHSDERQVPHYRVGRVFLAGDAAHCHSPAGGQGMNTGLQDAANLSWKLAAAVNGWAPPGQLDTYEAERHPVGQAVIRSSGLLLRIALVRPALLRAARPLVVGLALRIPTVAERAAETVSAIAVAYPAGRGEHRLVGRRAPDVALAGGEGRLYEALRGGRFVLVSAGDRPAAAEGWSDRVAVVLPADPRQVTMLVRPDGYIAWAAGGPDARSHEATLRTALATWCGAPSESEPALTPRSIPE